MLERCAEAGRLRVDPETAAQVVMSANVGVALSIVTQPEVYADPELSTLVRDAVHDRLLTPGRGTAPPSADTSLLTASVHLAALLRTRRTALTEAETALMLQWLDALAAAAIG